MITLKVQPMSHYVTAINYGNPDEIAVSPTGNNKKRAPDQATDRRYRQRGQKYIEIIKKYPDLFPYASRWVNGTMKPNRDLKPGEIELFKKEIKKAQEIGKRQKQNPNIPYANPTEQHLDNMELAIKNPTAKNPATGQVRSARELARFESTLKKYRPQSAGTTPAETTPATPATAPATPATAQTVQEMVTGIQSSLDQFNQIYETQKQIAGPVIQQIYDVLNTISQVAPGMQLGPNVYPAAQKLMTILQQATDEEAQDTQFIQQISQAATAVATALRIKSNAADNDAGVVPKTTPQNTGVIPNTTLQDTGNKGWAQSIGEFAGKVRNIGQDLEQGYRNIRPATPASNRMPVLTASMGSPSAILNYG